LSGNTTPSIGGGQLGTSFCWVETRHCASASIWQRGCCLIEASVRIGSDRAAHHPRVRDGFRLASAPGREAAEVGCIGMLSQSDPQPKSRTRNWHPALAKGPQFVAAVYLTWPCAVLFKQVHKTYTN